MSTRLYLTNNGAVLATVTPDASWEVTGSVVRIMLDLAKDGSDDTPTNRSANSGATNTPAQAVDVLVLQGVSPPLSGTGTISGGIKGQIRAFENTASADERIQMVARVVDSAGTTVRGTLFGPDTAALSSEFSTGVQNRKAPRGGTVTPTSVNWQDGDRIIVEWGYRKHENAATSRTGTFSTGGLGATAGGTDLPEDETTSAANAPWIEFADTLPFKTAAIRDSQQVVQFAIQAATVDDRVSQLVVQFAISNADKVVGTPTPTSARSYVID